MNIYFTMSITNKNLSLNLATILIYLFPIAIVFSPFFANGIIFFVSLYGIVNYKNINLKDIYKNKFIILFVLYWIYISIRSLFADNIIFSIKSSFLYIKYLLFLLSFLLIIKKNKTFLNNFTKFFLIIFLIIITDAFLQFFVGINSLGYSAAVIENKRISGFFGDELILGSYIVRFSFLIIALIHYSNFKNKNYLIFLIIILSFSTSLISGERTALALSILSIIFYFLLTNSISYKLKLLIIFILTCILFISYNYNEKISHRMQMTIKDLSSSEHILMFTKGHGDHFKTALNLYKENILFGQGANMFRIKCGDKKYFVKPYGCSTHPHNMYIQLLAETGLIGFTFLLFLFFQVSYFSLKHFIYKYFKRKEFLNEYELALLTCMLINFWPIIPTGNFFSSSFGNIAIIPIIFLFLSNKFKHVNLIK